MVQENGVPSSHVRASAVGSSKLLSLQVKGRLTKVPVRVKRWHLVLCRGLGVVASHLNPWFPSYILMLTVRCAQSGGAVVILYWLLEDAARFV